MAKELKIELIVDDKGTATLKSFADGAATHLKKVEGAGQSMGAGFAKTWQGMAVGLNQGIQLFQQLAGAVQAPIEAYMEAEKAQLKMGMAMKNQGDFSREALADMEDYAAQLQKTTAYEDDATLSVMANMKSYGMSNEQVKAATKAALDLASAKASEGMTVERASEMLGKSYLGISTGLKKLGIQVDDTKSKSELFNSVMGQVEDRFGGSAQAELLTYAGQWKQLKNQWQDIQEFLGLVFLKTIEAVGFTMSMMGATFWKVAGMILDGWGQIVGAMADVSKFIGLEKLGGTLEGIADGLKAGAVNAEEASAAAIANADANYKNMMSFDKVSNAIDAMGKTGKRTTGQFKEDAKTQQDILKSLTAANKERYEEAISDADHYVKMQKLAGQNELNFALGIIDRKTEALDTWYDKQGDDINNTIMKESEKQAKLTALDAEYNKKWNDLANQQMEKTVEVIEFEKRARQTYITWERSASAKQASERRRDYGDLASVSEQTWNDIREYEYLTGKKITKDQHLYASLMLDEYKDTFFGGMKAGFYDLQKNAMTWGKANTEIVKSMSSAMASTFSNVFEDAYKGDLKSISSYATSMFDTIRKKFFDIVAQMAAEEVMLFFKTAWTEGGGNVLGIINKVLGIAGSIYDDLSGDWSGMGGGHQGGLVSQDGVGMAAGGYVKGRANFSGNHPGNDTVPAWLSPGEMVIRRTSVNSDTADILDYINKRGTAPGMYNGGSVSGIVTDQPNRGYWGFSDFVGALTGGISIAVEGAASGNPIGGIVNSLIAWNKNPIIEAMDAFGTTLGTLPQRVLKELGLMSQDVFDLNYKYTEELAHFVGSMFAAAGFAQAIAGGAGTVGSGATSASVITSDMIATTARNTAIEQGASELVAQAAYEAAFTANMQEAGQQALTAMALKTIKHFAIKTAISAALGSKFPAGKGQMEVSYEGAQDNGMLSDLGKSLTGIAPKEYAFPARNGLDYIPRDNFRINAHEGEAVLTKKAAKAWRAGKSVGSDGSALPPVTINWQVDGRTLASITYKQTRAGVKMIHERGITNV